MIPAQKRKERSTDRVVVLKPKEGERTISSTGLVDPRLFSGVNKLHIVQNPKDCLWSMRYEMGGLPEPLKQRFVNFPSALQCAKQYFDKRNIQIMDVID